MFYSGSIWLEKEMHTDSRSCFPSALPGNGRNGGGLRTPLPLYPWSRVHRSALNLGTNFAAHKEIFFKYIYHALIDLELKGRPFAVPNQSENGKYNLISVWFNNISKRFLWVREASASRTVGRLIVICFFQSGEVVHFCCCPNASN